MQYLHVDKFPRLTGVPSPPKGLYVRGKFSQEKLKKCVAVVGSRRMTNYGRQVIDKLIPQLVFEKKTVISGFMYGVDQYAHEQCVAAGGITVAVLGWGIETPMEASDEELSRKIIGAGGLILSEWKQQLGTLWTFPVRNRIVAGLAEEIYVIEAAEKSGSLLTAELGHKFQKKVWAVPGPITSKTSAGTNRLINSGRAEMWIGNQTSNDIEENNPILKILADEPLSANEIARKLHQPITQTGADLSVLELTNQIISREGKYYLNHAN